MHNHILRAPEISVAILRLISDAKSYCYIVSPYIKIWPQLERVLQRASVEQKFVTFIIRREPKTEETIRKLNGEFGFEVYVVDDIHIKLYMNETTCLISSMNLYETSQTKNLEIGYYTKDHKQFLKEIVQDYILKDHRIQHYPGRFEEARKQKQVILEEYKVKMVSAGFCVDCKASIDSDFDRHRPYYIRCKECYSKCTGQDDPIKYCHYCGELHTSNGEKPLHEKCHAEVREMREALKGQH